jgi:hypothetical protein
MAPVKCHDPECGDSHHRTNILIKTSKYIPIINISSMREQARRLDCKAKSEVRKIVAKSNPFYKR